MKFNLKGWHKVSSDKDHSTLENADGHQLKIAHKKLHPEHAKALSMLPQKMDDGGSVQPKPKDDVAELPPANAAAGAKGASEGGTTLSQGWQNLTHPKWSKGGAVKMADGGETPTSARDLPAEEPSVDAPINLPVAANVEPVPMPSVSTPEATAADMSSPPPADEPNPQPTGESPPAPDMSANQPAPPDTTISPSQPVSSTTLPASNISATRLPSAEESYGKGLAGNKLAAKAEGAIAQQTADIMQHQAAQQQELNNKAVQKRQEIMQQGDDFLQDMKAGHIDPNHYMGSMDTPKRISTAIGLLLGGIGGGLLHQENPALKFLNAQIDRDVDAQKANLGQKRSLYEANLQQFHNVQDATDATRLGMAHLAQDQLAQAAAAQGTPLAKSRQMQADAELGMKYGPMLNDLSMRRALYDINANGQQTATQQNNPTAGVEQSLNVLRTARPEAAKELEGRLIPGVGLASIPLTPDDRKDVLGKNDLDQKLNQYIAFAKQNSGSLNPGTIAQGKAMAAELQGAYRQATHGGVYKEGESKFIDGLIDSDPTKFANELRGVIPKANQLKSSNLASLNLVHKNLGLPPVNPAANFNPQQKAVLQWAQANPNHPAAQMALKKLGIQ